MPKYQVQLDDGRKFQVEADQTPTEQEIMQALEGHESAAPTKPVNPNQSVLSPAQRGLLSLSDKAGAKKYLQKIFPDSEIGTDPASGKYTVDGNPTDPSGFRFSDIPGDIADVAGEALPMGGMVAGEALGSPLGLPGMVLGGGEGAARGEQARLGLGRMLGVAEDDQELASRMRNARISGYAGELAAPVIKAAAPYARKLTEAVGKQTDQAVKTLVHFFADVPPESTQRLLDKGAKSLLVPKNMASDALLNVGKKLNENLRFVRDEAEKNYWKAVKSFKLDNQTKVPMDEARQFLTDQLSTLGVVDDATHTLNPAGFSTSQGERMLRKIYTMLTPKSLQDDLAQATFSGRPVSPDVLEQIMKQVKPSSAPVGANDMTSKDVFNLVRKIDDAVKYGKEGQLRVSGQEEAVLKQFRGLLMGKLEDIHGPALTSANKDFSKVARLYDNLSRKLSMESVESTLKNFRTSKDLTRQQIVALEGMTSPSKKVYENLHDVLAAQDFNQSTFRGIRSGIVKGALLSMLQPFGVPASVAAIPSMAAGITLSTPKAVSRLISTTQTLGRAFEEAARRGLIAGGTTAGKTAISTEVRRNLNKGKN